MNEQPKAYQVKLIESLRMEAQLCAQLAAARDNEFAKALDLLGRKMGAAADELDYLRAGLKRIAEGMADSMSYAQNLLDGKA